MSGDAQAWEEAYLRFETPAAETRKFRRRLLRLGAAGWPRTDRVVELFCGRGNGLHALAGLGFVHLAGVDLSPALVARYAGRAPRQVMDCRRLGLADASCDIAIVQGGLHHLETLPDDLAATLAEIHRVLATGGRLVCVEPWLTPFLTVVHRACASPSLRWIYRRLDALATMIEHERHTYENWLGRPAEILALIDRWFEVEQRRLGWGKLELVARRRQEPSS